MPDTAAYRAESGQGLRCRYAAVSGRGAGRGFLADRGRVVQCGAYVELMSCEGLPQVCKDKGRSRKMEPTPMTADSAWRFPVSTCCIEDDAARLPYESRMLATHSSKVSAKTTLMTRKCFRYQVLINSPMLTHVMVAMLPMVAMTSSKPQSTQNEVL